MKNAVVKYIVIILHYGTLCYCADWKIRGRKVSQIQLYFFMGGGGYKASYMYVMCWLMVNLSVPKKVWGFVNCSKVILATSSHSSLSYTCIWSLRWYYEYEEYPQAFNIVYIIMSCYWKKMSIIILSLNWLNIQEPRRGFRDGNGLVITRRLACCLNINCTSKIRNTNKKTQKFISLCFV